MSNIAPSPFFPVYFLISDTPIKCVLKILCHSPCLFSLVFSNCSCFRVTFQIICPVIKFFIYCIWLAAYSCIEIFNISYTYLISKSFIWLFCNLICILTILLFFHVSIIFFYIFGHVKHIVLYSAYEVFLSSVVSIGFYLMIPCGYCFINFDCEFMFLRTLSIGILWTLDGTFVPAKRICLGSYQNPGGFRKPLYKIIGFRFVGLTGQCGFRVKITMRSVLWWRILKLDIFSATKS